ncbi:hypothetical protein KUTeg_016916 [Tegillarca granosa]|uniref:Uncharacterized protein n=1 Tax=Tegillarca granosa TaxID=220873 RepID=A0ABQ9ER50_TEGGR|nr:hypothetical protein KUTeg_016916 [Tegillarca granosa]
MFRYLAEKYLEQINCDVDEDPLFTPKLTIGDGLLDQDTVNHTKDNNSKVKIKSHSKSSSKNKHKRQNGLDETIKLEPSKRRTKGKKSVLSTSRCVIL